MVSQGERLPMGLVISRGDKILADQGVDYTTDAPARLEVTPGAETTVTFTAETKEGLKLTKRFTFRDGSTSSISMPRLEARRRTSRPSASTLANR